MTKSEINMIEAKINDSLELLRYEWDHGDRNSLFFMKMRSEIIGMIDILNLLTGDVYYFDDKGLHKERGTK